MNHRKDDNKHHQDKRRAKGLGGFWETKERMERQINREQFDNKKIWGERMARRENGK